jgi:hypothetical protein
MNGWSKVMHEPILSPHVHLLPIIHDIAVLSNPFQIGSEFYTACFSSDFHPSDCMFNLNFLLESAMHEGLIWLKISKITFPLQQRFSTPDPDHSTSELSLHSLFNIRSRSLKLWTTFPLHPLFNSILNCRSRVSILYNTSPISRKK